MRLDFLDLFLFNYLNNMLLGFTEQKFTEVFFPQEEAPGAKTYVARRVVGEVIDDQFLLFVLLRCERRSLRLQFLVA